MPATTSGIPEERRDILNIVASVEKRDIKDMLMEIMTFLFWVFL